MTIPNEGVFGKVLLQATPDRLTLRSSLKTRVKNWMTLGVGLVPVSVWILSLFSYHRWVWPSFFLGLVALGLCMSGLALLHRRDECVWDRAIDTLIYRGVPILPLSLIVAVETEKCRDDYQTILVHRNGVRLPVPSSLAAFSKAEDAERFRLSLETFLGLVPLPASVWPPPAVRTDRKIGPNQVKQCGSAKPSANLRRDVSCKATNWRWGRRSSSG